jgi:hypothetical protein
MGAQYIAVGVDTAMIYSLTRKLVAELRTAASAQTDG